MNSRRKMLVAVLLCAACTPGDAGPAGSGETAVASPGIEVEYVAHAAFLFRSDGTELLIDPYASNVWLGYQWPGDIDPDAVLITHPHYDHDAGRFREMPFPWSGDVPVFDAPGQASFGPFHVTGVEGKHADPYGKEFGQLNTIMVIEAHGVRIAHLGDNGPLAPEALDAMGRIDVLMMPGDAVYHILSPSETDEIIRSVDPSVVIPMHYRIPALEVEDDSPSDLGDVEPWLEGRPAVRRVEGHTAVLRASDLEGETTILVFDHAPYVTR